MKNIEKIAKEIISSFTIKKPLKLKENKGETRKSLENAKAIKDAGYVLAEAIMYYDVNKADYQLDCKFLRDNETENFSFNGFSFGYGGEGPHGLYEMLKMFGYDTIGIKKKIFDFKFDEQNKTGKWIII